TLNIWTMTNGRATLNRVLTAQLTDYKIQITQGLQPDDTLIGSGGMNLHEGEKVEVVECAMNIMKSALNNHQVSLTLTFLIMVGGVYSLLNMSRREGPPFSIRTS